MSEPPYIAGSILSTDPLVTISKFEGPRAGILGARRDLLRGREALHLLGLCSTYETEPRIEQLVAALDEATGELPGNRIVVLANSELEAYMLGQAGVPALFANELIFVDETRFVPMHAAPDTFEPCDAVYCARFVAHKRHALAARVPRPMFIYPQLKSAEEEEYRRIRQLVPKAVFANHELGGGKYRWLDHREVAGLMNRCRVGLCLSEAEGAMRSSMEYLMCGLPIVSTPSVGGRDRYFDGPICMIVEPDADAVARGVRHQIGSNFDKRRVRNHIGLLVAFDRRNFLNSINKLVKQVMGVDRMFPSFAPFVGHPVYWRPAEEVLADLAAPAATEGS